MSPKKYEKEESSHDPKWGSTIPWASTALRAFMILCTNSINAEKIHNKFFKENSFIKKTD